MLHLWAWWHETWYDGAVVPQIIVGTHKSGSLVLPRRVGALPGTRPFLARRRNSYHLSLGNENRTWRRHMKASEQNSHCAVHRNSINFNHLETVSGRSPGHLWLWVLRSELAGVAGLAQTNRSGKVFVVFDGHKRLVAPELAFSHLEVRLIPGSLAMNSPMHQHTQDIKLEPACTETLACPYSLVAGSFFINFTNELLQQYFNEVIYIFEHEADLYRTKGFAKFAWVWDLWWEVWGMIQACKRHQGNISVSHWKCM